MIDPWSDRKPTGVLVLADGRVFYGQGAGRAASAVGEICFNTSITGYQEIMTDASYAGQIITFTFPHIGNVGANDEDVETFDMDQPSAAVGCIMRASITDPSNYRSASHFNVWLDKRGIVGLYGLDTRALTGEIRENGMQNGAVCYRPDGVFDLEKLNAMASGWAGLDGADLASDVSIKSEADWAQSAWQWAEGFAEGSADGPHIVVVDFGVKRNILRLFADAGCKVTVVPGDTGADRILALNPDGLFLSNGPGDPAATGEYAVPMIKALIDSGKPIFGICLGHQMLALALGGTTLKMHQGHHGANHPVYDKTTGKVEITSMNHGFAVDAESLPESVEQTHKSLFDGTNCGLQVKGKLIFSVQHHPEASPGPQDSHYLFDRFLNLVTNA